MGHGHRQKQCETGLPGKLSTAVRNGFTRYGNRVYNGVRTAINYTLKGNIYTHCTMSHDHLREHRGFVMWVHLVFTSALC